MQDDGCFTHCSEKDDNIVIRELEGKLFYVTAHAYPLWTFHKLAMSVANELPDNAERGVALRKLLEAKDAAVRASI